MTVGKNVIQKEYPNDDWYKTVEKSIEIASTERAKKEYIDQAEWILDIENWYDQDEYNEIDNEESLSFD